MKLKRPAGWSRRTREEKRRGHRNEGDARKCVGEEGEALAARFYEGEGYEVLSRNWRTREGELDLVLLKGARLVFVEVRTRTREGEVRPEDTVTFRKRRRVLQQAQRWLSAHEELAKGREVVFEVVGVVLSTGELVRIEDAFVAG